MTPVEILALILAVAVIIKLLFVVAMPRTWARVVKGFYSNSAILVAVELILAIIVFYYLYQELTLIQIAAGILLGALLTGMSFAFFGKELLPVITKALNRNAVKKAWLLILLWFAFAIWILAELF